MMDLYQNCRMVPKLINSLGLDTVSELDVRNVGLALIYNGKLQGNTLCLKRNSNRPSIKSHIPNLNGGIKKNNYSRPSI